MAASPGGFVSRGTGLVLWLLVWPGIGFIQQPPPCSRFVQPWRRGSATVPLLAAPDEAGGASRSASAGAMSPVNSRDPRETRPSLPEVSEDEMDDVDEKFVKRKRARHERIAKKYGKVEADLDAANDVVPTRDTAYWYAVKVKVGMEQMLRDTLVELSRLPAYRGRINEVLAPLVKGVRSLGKSLRVTEKPLYPGYVFVNMKMSRELYDVILSPNGVGAFVGRKFPGKGVVPKPMRAEEVQRLQERAAHEAGRTIDLTTIPFKPQDKVEVLSGEFAFARGRVTSVKETTVFAVVKKGQVEVRIELPFDAVRKLTQEDLDAELKDWGEEALRAYNKARPDSGMESDDMWKRIRDSNAAATKGFDPSSTAGREPKKRGPEKKGPSLKKMLSAYINLDDFDPTKPPDVEEMVEGMLELTGKGADVGGYYRDKAEKAVKAWKIWKEHLEEKEERRRKSREKAGRRKAMGFDEFDDSWKTRLGYDPDREDRRRGGLDGDSWGFDGGRDGKRKRGTRDGFVDGIDQWDFGGGGGGAGAAQEDSGTSALEMDFLEKLMKDLDSPTAGLSTATDSGSARSRAPAMGAPPAGRQGSWGQQGQREEDADMQQLRGMKRYSGEGGGLGGKRASQATLTREEQDEFDKWMEKLTATPGDNKKAPQQDGWANPGMGAKPRSTYRRESTLDSEEEQELNEWLSKFDQQYSEEGSKVVKKPGATAPFKGGLGSSPLPSLDGLLGEGDGGLDDELNALFGGGAGGGGSSRVGELSGLRSPPRSKSVAEAREQVDRELDAVLAKLDALDGGSSSSSSKKAGGVTDRRSPVVNDVAFTSMQGKAARGATSLNQKQSGAGKSVSWRDDENEDEEDDDDDEEEDDFLPRAFKRGKQQAPAPPSRRVVSRRDSDDEDEEGEEEDRSLARLLEGEELEDDRAASLMIHSKLWGSGQESEDAYLDPEDTPGQFFEDEVEEAIEMGLPIKDMGKQPGFMVEGPAVGDEAAGARGRAGGRLMGGPSYTPSRGSEDLGAIFSTADWAGGADDDDLTADLDDRDLEKLDKMFAEEAKKMGGRAGEIDWGAIMGAAEGGDDDDLLGLGLLDDELKGLAGLGRAGGDKGKAKAGKGAGKAAEGGVRKKVGPGGGSAGQAGGFEKMKVAELKDELKRRGLPVTGTKSELLARLTTAP